jgi:hypothetical protein
MIVPPPASPASFPRPLPVLNANRSADDQKMCPFRSISELESEPRCWGIRCAAFQRIDATTGTCALIPRGGVS